MVGHRLLLLERKEDLVHWLTGEKLDFDFISNFFFFLAVKTKMK